MKLCLLGGGEEALAVGRSLLEAGHEVTHFGPFDGAADAERRAFLHASGAKPVGSHAELDPADVDTALMVSYAPLIAPEHLARIRYLNIHFAPLPRMRGMHPLQWTLINDEPEAGFTLHLADEGIDSGPIFHQSLISVGDDDDYASLRRRIIALVTAEVGNAVRRIEEGCVPVPQDHRSATIMTRRVKSDGEIDWNHPARRIFNLVRALRPPAMPGATTSFQGSEVALGRVSLLPNPPYLGPTGKIVAFAGDAAWVKCGDTLLQIDECWIDGRSLAPRTLFPRVGVRLGRAIY